MPFLGNKSKQTISLYFIHDILNQPTINLFINYKSFYVIQEK